jgi:hypothetical protein
MEHRRVVSFVTSSLLLAAMAALAAPSLASAAPNTGAPDRDQAPQGPYRGAYVCQSMIAGPVIFRVPIDLVIRNGNVEFARPLLNRNGTRLVGNEMASGTIDGNGKVHLTSEWFNGGIMFRADYNGTLTPSGGTLMGTQTWRGPRGLNGTRTCTAALVQLAGTNRVPAQQSGPDRSPAQQSFPDQPPAQQSQPEQSEPHFSPDELPPQE